MERRRKTIPTILTSEEILDKSFRRVAGIKKKGTDRLDGAKKTAIAKITASADIVSSTLDRYVKAFPSFEKGEEFRLEIVDVLVGVDKLKKSLGALAWCARRSSELGRDYLSRIRKASEVSEVLRLKKEFYGRLSSIVNQIQEELRFVSSARDKLRRMPTIDLSVPTVVIAGYPNVGKSQLVERISTAKPLIATYPFTTKGIGVGHFTGGWRRYQVIDTPGLLDRTLEERNRIELQAILALKYLADLIVFILDPSETSGYTMERQLSLLESVRKGFEDIPILEVDNKVDVLRTESARMKISALTGEGVPELVAKIIEIMRAGERSAEEPR